ncbi:MAG: hypothetical protein N2376_05850 [Clostridia bacterium]|nr:hypothetical protein [Clostridia bacterium]
MPKSCYQLDGRFQWMTSINYFLLVVMVILLLAFWVNYMGVGDPYYCKFVCPNGTVFGALPLMLANPLLFRAAGTLFV